MEENSPLSFLGELSVIREKLDVDQDHEQKCKHCNTSVCTNVLFVDIVQGLGT